MILIDTSVWIDADKQPTSHEAIELAALLGRDEAATTDLVVAEVLQGALTEENFAFLSGRLDAMHYLHAVQETWKHAAHMSFELKRKGLTTPLSDLVIAAVALRADVPLYATDPHFQRVEGLHLYRP